MVKLDTVQPVLAKEAKLFTKEEIEAVSESKAYRATIQLGARKKWRTHRGGQWVLAAEDAQSGQKEYVHKGKVSQTEPILGKTLAGLMTLHNKWVSNNHNPAPVKGTDSTNHQRGTPVPMDVVKAEIYAGDVSQQFLVLDYEETDEPANDAKMSSPMDMIAQVVNAAIKGVLEAQDSKKTPQRSNTK